MKKIKYIAILTIVASYVLQLCFVFSGTLVENFQEIRYQNQISKLHLSETKKISIDNWNDFNNKREIKINGIFYDVASFKVVNKIVIVHVVADSFENQMRINFESLFHKSKKTDSNQKKTFNCFNFIAVINNIETQKITARIEIFKPKVYFTIIQNTINSVLNLDKPPC